MVLVSPARVRLGAALRAVAFMVVARAAVVMVDQAVFMLEACPEAAVPAVGHAEAEGLVVVGQAAVDPEAVTEAALVVGAAVAAAAAGLVAKRRSAL